MTIRIDEESLAGFDDFAGRVARHAAAVAEYETHLRGVEEDAANETLKPEERRVAFPPPSEHPTVEAAVKAGGYELVGPSLEVRKQRLCAAVDLMERSGIADVTPDRKRRWFNFRIADIASKDDDAVTHEDASFLDDQQARAKREMAVRRWAAKQHHDIDDLTEETIDAWKPEPFSA